MKEELQLITTHSTNIWWDDYYVNDLTKTIKKQRNLNELSKFTSCPTDDEHNEIIMYPLEDAEDGNKISVIRYPGMTIGHVAVNKDDIIFEVMIYTKENGDMKFEIVPKETVAEIQKYIGYKLIFIEE